MTRILLVLSYLLLILARAINAISRRDPLRLRRPPQPSLWIERDATVSDLSYFSESSPAELRSNSAGRLPASFLSWVARFYAPARTQSREKFSAAADREQGIPDEMYTLW
jgi:hypothetical protein